MIGVQYTAGQGCTLTFTMVLFLSSCVDGGTVDSWPGAFSYLYNDFVLELMS